MIEYMFGDSIEQMDILIAQKRKFKLIFADIPFGTTNCKWDSIIPFEKMWDRINKLSYEDTAVVLCGQQPFTSALIMSNIKNFKYQWVYEKAQAGAGFNAKKRPLSAHEDIIVFYKKQPTYNPQITNGHKRKVSSAKSRIKCAIRNNEHDKAYNNQNINNIPDYDSTERYPRSVLKFSTDKQKIAIHGTQKPIALGQYIIKTYLNKGEDMLDFTCGSGSFLVAADLEEVNAVGIDNGFCDRDKEINGHKLKGMKWVDISRLRVEGKI